MICVTINDDSDTQKKIMNWYGHLLFQVYEVQAFDFRSFLES